MERSYLENFSQKPLSLPQIRDEAVHGESDFNERTWTNILENDCQRIILNDYSLKIIL